MNRELETADTDGIAELVSSILETISDGRIDQINKIITNLIDMKYLDNGFT